MDNKYYIPKIDEFRVGFEYEVYLDSSDWEKQVYTNQTVIDEYGLKYERYRVKYLDKDDIESLKYISIIPSNVIDKDNYHITHWSNNIYGDGIQILHCYPYKGKYFISFGQDEHSIPLFTGIIKNKSKLKEILECIIPTETE